MFLENFVNHFPFTKGADGGYEANWPCLASDGPLWVYPAVETGTSSFDILISSLCAF